MSTWTRVYYNNALGFVPVLLFGFMFGEYKHINAKPITMTSLCVLLLACVVGLGISFAGFHARKLLSATSFTVLGVSNKFISIALSLIFISSAKTISWTSLFGLLMCIVCATLYAKTKSKWWSGGWTVGKIELCVHTCCTWMYVNVCVKCVLESWITR